LEDGIRRHQPQLNSPVYPARDIYFIYFHLSFLFLSFFFFWLAVFLTSELAEANTGEWQDPYVSDSAPNEPSPKHN
jgi:hypothetical protein